MCCVVVVDLRVENLFPRSLTGLVGSGIGGDVLISSPANRGSIPLSVEQGKFCSVSHSKMLRNSTHLLIKFVID